MIKINLTRNRWTIIITSWLVLATALNWLGWLRVPATAASFLAPVSKPLTRAGQNFGSFISELGRVGEFSSETAQLKQENANLQGEIARLKELEVQNQQLRQQLNFPPAGKIQVIGADVISFSPDNLRQRLVINRGSNDGLGVGMSIIWANQLVGKITAIAGSTAQVQLVSDQDFRILATDQQTGTPGIIKGQAGGSLAMERIPQTEVINEGDIVISSGQDGEFPAGIVIGKITAVSNDAGSIFKTARIEQSFSKLELRVVMVVTARQ
jgi:rod shape-determining protein MreC